MDAKLVDTGRLTGTRDTTDAHTDTMPAVRQTLIDNLLGTRLMVGVDTLDERDGLREDGDITLEDALHHFGDGIFTTTEAFLLQIGIDDRRLFHAAVHLQACIFGTILGMIHIYFSLFTLILMTTLA